MNNTDIRPIRVLLVDDEPEIADLAATVLEQEEELIVEVETRADEAVDRFQDDTFDCVVVDFMMPGMDGVEFLKAIRATHPDLPVILFTGKGDEVVASEAISAGVTDYVRKGPGMDQYDRLATKIKTLVETARVEQRIEAERQRYEALIEGSTDVIAVLDGEGAIAYISPSIAREAGHDPEDLVGENAFEYVHPDDRAEVIDRFEVGLSDPARVVTADFRFRTADGDWIFAEARGRNLLEDSAVEGFVVNARNVTERVEREQDLMAERALTRAIFETIPDVVFAFDEDGDPLRDDLVLSDIPGYTDEELREMHPLEFVPDEDEDMLADAIATVLEEGGVETRASALVTKDGQRIPHEFKSTRLHNADGDVIGLVGTARDISHRLERERELEAQNERLEEFASIVSHDLRNPLNVAKGNLQRVADGEEEAIEPVDRALDRMEGLIEDLLTLAREGEAIDEPTSVDLADLAEDAWAAVETPEATLRVAGDMTVEADRSRLQQLLENLFRNAIQHGGEDVTVVCGPLTLGEGFFVEDDGPGIPADTQDKVFEYGFPTDGGTGLGLSIVRQITAAHGWEVDVSDGVNGGARFEFTGVTTQDRQAVGGE